MYCEDKKGRRTDLSSEGYKSCVGKKCGGWRWIQPGCTPHAGNCGSKSGAWLPAAEVCRLNLYAKFQKRIKPSSSSSVVVGSSSSSVVVSSVGSDPLTINGAIVDPNDYFDTSLRPITLYSGPTGVSIVVPEWLGYNTVIYVDSSGSLTQEYVVPGDVLTFRSSILLGYDPEGSQAQGLPDPPEFTVESIGNLQEVGPVYTVTVAPVAGATGYVFRFEGVAIKPDRIGPSPEYPDYEGKGELASGQYQYFMALEGTFLTAASVNENGTGVFSSPKLIDGGCCYPSDGNFYLANYHSCMENNNDGRNIWIQGDCAEADSSDAFIMSNLSLLRDYSLDKGLMDLYFNQGVNPMVVDLDQSQSLAAESSDSVGGFSLIINLSQKARNPFGEEFAVPEDVELYIYSETVDGAPSPAMITASKVVGQNSVVVSLDHDPRPDGSSEFSFQINVEHEDFNPARTTFVFRNDIAYEYSVELYGRAMNMPGRLPPDYIEYLYGWMQGFWSAYDDGDLSKIPTFTNPPLNANTQFYPFLHATWRLLEPQTGIIRAQTVKHATCAPSDKNLVEPWNFLGVEPEIFKCITKALYKESPREKYGVSDRNGTTMQDQDKLPFPSGSRKPVYIGKRKNDSGFDCRSFSICAALFLKQQLKSICPNAKVKVQLVKSSNDRKVDGHAIVHVDLGGSPDPCCVGSFLYEPQAGFGGLCDTYTDFEDYCKNNPCADDPDLGSIPISPDIEDPGFQNPDWEDYPEEVSRISDGICGCLTGSYHPDSVESFLTKKCEDGTLGDWFKGRFQWDPWVPGGPPDSALPLNLPQILSCERVKCVNQNCIEDECGVEPYVCNLKCSSSSSPSCPPMCEWIWRASSGTWEPRSGGLGVAQGTCASSGCSCFEPDYSGTFDLEVNVTNCGL